MGTRDYLIVASDVQREEIPNDIMSVGRSSSRGITSLRSCQKLVHSGFPPLLLYATRAAHWAQSSKKRDASTNTLTPIHERLGRLKYASRDLSFALPCVQDSLPLIGPL